MHTPIDTHRHRNRNFHFQYKQMFDLFLYLSSFLAIPILDTHTHTHIFVHVANVQFRSESDNCSNVCLSVYILHCLLSVEIVCVCLVYSLFLFTWTKKKEATSIFWWDERMKYKMKIKTDRIILHLCVCVFLLSLLLPVFYYLGFFPTEIKKKSGYYCHMCNYDDDDDDFFSEIDDY